ncbi:LysE family translocator [Streptomyces asoensis]|uniref:LysE family translocator n=1 Tax=Streptomyces asoensis TaxID=249586 RepID=A0A6M4WJA3_9ACTN|nr:LysE family translocator [Streptomyces asoensis]QJS99274.1 LysE family translocator [Streptomyces asoensis]
MSVDLAGFLGVVMVAYLVPGPDFLVIVRAATVRAALGRAAALGAQTGLCLHMVAAALGLSVVAARSPVAFTAIKLAGAAYLVALGVRALVAARRVAVGRRGGRPGPVEGADDGEREQVSTGRADSGPGGHGTWGRSFLDAFLTNVLNPKAALFFLSVLPQFVDHDGSLTGQIFFLGTVDVLIGVVYWLALVGVAARLRALLSRSAFRHRWDVTTGWLFIAIGVGVAAAN